MKSPTETTSEPSAAQGRVCVLLAAVMWSTSGAFTKALTRDSSFHLDTPPIDYLAKDFEGFRRALFEFSALRYPAWRERSEADFGVMFAEALARPLVL